VNLLPFIDVQLLKDTIAKHCPPTKLSATENRRNAFGKVFCYRYDINCNDTVPSPNRRIGLSDIIGSNTSLLIIDKQETVGEPFKPELLPGTRIPYPGFPSLRVLPFASVELTRIGLNVFGSPSKYPTMVLSFYQMPELPPLEALATAILGKSLFINWPMMHEGRVVAISNEEKEIRLVKEKSVTKKFKDNDVDRWHAESDAMLQMYNVGNGVPGSGGVAIGDIKIRLKLNPLQGMKTNPSNGSTKKLFGREEADVPLQLALWEAPAPDPRFIERGPVTLADRFPENCSVVLTKGKYRGCKGTVLGVADQKNVGVKVHILPSELPFGLAIARSIQETYLSSADAARILKMPSGLFGKLTGKLQFEQGKFDLGLNLKSADGTCVVGYTRRKLERQQGFQGKGKKTNVWQAGDSVLVVGSERMSKPDDDTDERIQWEYSPKAVRLVEAYRQKFPQLFIEIKKSPNEKKYDANKVFGPNGEAWLPVIREWLDKHESAKLPRSPVTSESMSYDAVAAVQKAADVRSLALKKRGFPKESLIKIPGSALYREGSTGATDVLLTSDLNHNQAPELGDRIVNLCADGVPFGARGTVVGIHEAATTGSVEVVMDEEFIGGTSLQGACSNFRGKLCLWSHLLKLEPDNSKELVDRMVPKVSGRAAVDRIISSIEREVKNDKSLPIQSSWDAAVDAETPPSRNITPTVPPQLEGTRPALATPSRTGTTSKADLAKEDAEVGRAPRAASAPRTLSTGRSGRQGAWREAKGPDEKGNGFRGARPGTSGLKRWTEHVKNASAAKESTTKLKAILGVIADAVEPRTLPSTHLRLSDTEGAAAELKNLLGVGGASGSPSSEQLRAAADLKALLGVGTGPSGGPAPNGPPPPPSGPPPPPSGPPPPSSAADKLLQLMASKQPSPAMYQLPGPPRSSFNFTYVEEGKEPEPVPVPSYYAAQAPQGNPHPGFLHGFPPPIATPPPPSMHMMSFGSPNPQQYPFSASHPRPAPTQGTQSNRGPRGPEPRIAAPVLSLDQFPPLGVEPKPESTVDEPDLIPETPVAPRLLKPENTVMVPSVVAGSSKR
jgi:5'-3' exoribonuclease 1